MKYPTVKSVESSFGYEDKSELRKYWAVQNPDDDGWRILRVELRRALKTLKRQPGAFPQVQLYRVEDAGRGISETIHGTKVIGPAWYCTLGVLVSSRRLRIGCQEFTGVNRDVFVNWALARIPKAKKKAKS